MSYHAWIQSHKEEVDMAGHSKWANIRRKKEKVDKKRSKIFSRIAKEIITAVKVGGSPDPKSNPRLRLIVQKAKAANMPQDNIDRNIKKASRDDQSAFDEITYEMYGIGGVGLIIEVMTDNKNRSAASIRTAAAKNKANVAEPGSVAYNFTQKGVITITHEHADSEELFDLSIELGADEFIDQETHFVIYTNAKELEQVREGIEKAGIVCDEHELQMVPNVQVECTDETIESNMKLIDFLEDIDDVDAVYHNMQLQ